MEDYLSLLPMTLQWISIRLGMVSRIPWPLWIGGLFPLYVGAVSVILWILRGRAWPVQCAYPMTTKGRPCRMLVPGEWSRCRHHNRRVRYRYGHEVDTSVGRWQTITRDGKIVDRVETGVGVLRLRPAGFTLLYQRGYARPPLAVLKLVPTFTGRMYERLRQMRLSNRSIDPATMAPTVGDEASELEGARRDIAAGLSGVVQSTQFATAAFALALALSSLAILLVGTAQTVVQYLSVLGFVLAWAAISSGTYHRSTAWFRGACLKALKWWAVIFVPVGVLNLFFTIASSPPST